MTKVMSIVRTGIAQTTADPLYLVFALGMPVLMTWIMSFLPVEMSGLASGGVMVMFLGLNIMMSASSVIEERQNGTWARLLSAPVTRLEVLAGYLGKVLVTAWVQAAILLLSGRYLFRVPWSHFSGSVLVVLAAYILAMSGIGVLLATVLKTQQQVPAVATGISTVGTMLSGVFFPANGNKVMEIVARISPQGWAARGLNAIMAEGSGLSVVSEPVIWMAALGLLFLVVGLTRIRFE